MEKKPDNQSKCANVNKEHTQANSQEKSHGVIFKAFQAVVSWFMSYQLVKLVLKGVKNIINEITQWRIIQRFGSIVYSGNDKLHGVTGWIKETGNEISEIDDATKKLEFFLDKLQESWVTRKTESKSSNHSEPSMESNKKKKEADLLRAKEEIEKLRSKIDELQSKNADDENKHKSEIDMLQIKIGELENKIEDLEKKHEEELDKERKEKEEKGKKVEELYKENTINKTQIERLQNDVKTKESNIESLIQEVNKEKEERENSNEKLKEELEQCKEELQMKKNIPQDLTVAVKIVKGNGEYHGTDDTFIQQLTQYLKERGTTLQVSEDLTENTESSGNAKAVILFCLNSSRLGTDVDAAIPKVKDSTPDLYLVVFHHIGQHQSDITPSKGLIAHTVINKGIKCVVDCRYWSKDGLYQCAMNDRAIENLGKTIRNSAICEALDRLD